MRSPASLAFVVLSVALAACSGGPSAREIAPASEAELAKSFFRSAGDDLLRFAPQGADLVIEIDLQRIRENETVGPLYRAAAAISADVAPQFHPLRDADAIVLCAYDLGGVDAKTTTLVKSERLADLAESAAVHPNVVVVGDEQARERAAEVAAGSEPSLVDDFTFRSLRDRAVPEGAPGAAIRVTASLSFDARVSLASRLDLDHVPTSISAWGDVVDDFALVALLGADSAADAKRLTAASRRTLSDLAAHPLVSRLVLGYVFEEVQVVGQVDNARLVLHLSPQRLALLAKRLTRRAQELRQSGVGS